MHGLPHTERRHSQEFLCIAMHRLHTPLEHYPEQNSSLHWISRVAIGRSCWMTLLFKEKTAFSTGSGLWQFKVKPFGLCSTPATFEKLTEQVLFGLPMSVALVSGPQPPKLKWSGYFCTLLLTCALHWQEGVL